MHFPQIDCADMSFRVRMKRGTLGVSESATDESMAAASHVAAAIYPTVREASSCLLSSCRQRRASSESLDG